MTGQQLVPIWIVDVVVLCIDSKLVINSKHFCFPKAFLLLLLLFQLLEFKMPSKSFNDYDFFMIISYLRIDPRVESALLKLVHFLLPPLCRNPLLFFFQLCF